MKKRILMLTALMALCLTLCGCGGKKEIESLQAQLAEKEALIADYEAQLASKETLRMNLESEMNRQIEALQSEKENHQNELQYTIDEQAQQISELEMEKTELQQDIDTYVALMDQYGWAVDYLEQGEYDRLVSRLEDEKESARIAKLTENGVEEIIITLDNWDQYFEYVPTGYVYIRNAFGEATHMNMLGGIRLKDGYTLAPNWGTEVDFEMETHFETYSCTADFAAETFEYGDVIEVGTQTDTTTTSFNDYDEGGVNAFGSIAQINNDDGDLVTRDVRIEAISRMLRAEGSLFLCRD